MPKSDSVKTVKRSIDILNLLAEDGRQLGVIELSKRLKTSQSTVYRILSTLAAEGYVTQDPRTEKYHLGLQGINLAGAALNQLEIRKQAISILERLVSATSYNANLGILHRQHMMYIARIDGPKSARMYTPIGRRAPAHATALGKAILAFLPPDEAAPIVRSGSLVACTPHTIIDPAVLAEELRRIRQRGYAVDREEFLAGICCVGVPVRGPLGGVEAALSLSGSIFQLREEDTEQHARLLQDAAYELSGRLGYQV
ncbi:MAG TPA: IclR family transcriptional regulator [bacterium]|nr:IclR family transcriptional regulator [bacterium]